MHVRKRVRDISFSDKEFKSKELVRGEVPCISFLAFGNVLRDAGNRSRWKISLEYTFAFRSVVWYDIKDKVRGTVLKAMLRGIVLMILKEVTLKDVKKEM